MSTWTHVTGNIRKDGLPGVAPDHTVENLKKIIGPMEVWDEDIPEGVKLPTGSEGSLEYEVIEYSGGLPWVTIPIWGDLRNYDDLDAIKIWWFQTLKDLGGIRQAILVARCNDKTIILTEKGPS